MTLHWWQHWFWITGRSPVVALLALLLPCCLCEDAVVVAPRGVLPAVAARRLLGFAALGAEAASSAAPTAGPDLVVAYLTTPSASPPQPSREPKAIGVFTTTARPAPSAAPSSTLSVVAPSAAPSTAPSTAPTAAPSAAPPASQPVSTATSVRLEIIESVQQQTSPWTPPSSEASTTEDGGLYYSSAEMPNDEPSRATTATPTAEPAASSVSAAMSLSTAPGTVSGSSAPATSAAPSPVPTPTSASLNGSGSSGSSSPSSGSSSSSSTDQPEQPDAALEPASSHRSAQAPLGADAGAGKQHRVGALSSGGGLDAGSITGIVLGLVVLAGLAGTVSFVLYRRRYLNKPQTLNDKCSNPDSSGYIDDSTLRENSEEMYSLDNDSFLNSLEAMTIQNYWTDTVKHTKL